MKIEKVIRKSGKAARVILEDQTRVKVPVEMAVEGREVDINEFREVESGYKSDIVHFSLIPVRKRDMRPPVFSSENHLQYSADKELELIRSIVRIKMNQWGVRWSPEHVEDVTQGAFLHFWEKGYYKRYNPAILDYKSYISTGVGNFIKDYMKSSTSKLQNKTYSLNAAMSSESDGEFQDSVIDVTVNFEEDLCTSVMRSEMVESIREFALELGSDLEGTSYREVFEAILSGCNLNEFAADKGYSLSTIMKRKKNLLEAIKDEFPYYLGEVS